MKDFYHSERFKIELALGAAVVVYPAIILLLWLRLKRLYGSFVYPSVNGTADHSHPESFVTWLAPWCKYLALATLIGLCVAVILFYFLSFSGKELCADCLAGERRNFTDNYDDLTRQYVCPPHLEERREWTALEMAKERARAEDVGECPRCHKPMRKAIQKVLGIYVVSDVCKAHGRFSEWPEAELFAEEAYLAGLHAHPRKFARRMTDVHSITAAALHAETTAPILYLDDLDAV